jgi:hypothetical protein
MKDREGQKSRMAAASLPRRNTSARLAGPAAVVPADPVE